MIIERIILWGLCILNLFSAILNIVIAVNISPRKRRKREVTMQVPWEGVAGEVIAKLKQKKEEPTNCQYSFYCSSCIHREDCADASFAHNGGCDHYRRKPIIEEECGANIRGFRNE